MKTPRPLLINCNHDKIIIFSSGAGNLCWHKVCNRCIVFSHVYHQTGHLKTNKERALEHR